MLNFVFHFQDARFSFNVVKKPELEIFLLPNVYPNIRCLNTPLMCGKCLKKSFPKRMNFGLKTKIVYI